MQRLTKEARRIQLTSEERRQKAKSLAPSMGKIGLAYLKYSNGKF